MRVQGMIRFVGRAHERVKQRRKAEGEDNKIKEDAKKGDRFVKKRNPNCDLGRKYYGKG